MRFLLTQLILLGSLAVFAQPVVAFETIATGFSQPVDITGAGDGSDRLFVVEKVGRIRIIDQTDNSVLTQPYLDISDRVRNNGEQGLLGLTFHPNFINNGEFYVNYVSNGSGAPSQGQTVISRFTVNLSNGNLADANAEDILMTIDQPFSNHNAGDLAFGPDGYLYIPTGDGGSGGDPDERAQDPTTLLGKMLRIDVDAAPPAGGVNYVIPADNPFVNQAGVRDEIWAIGLRNPWRISFDRANGNLWIGDVGQNAREEVDFQPAGLGGLNYGWDCREGTSVFEPSSCAAGATYTDPRFDYNHNTTDGGFSLTGGFVYRGDRADDLLGYYVCADFDQSRLFLLPPAGAQADLTRQNVALNNITTFGEDDNARLYVAEFGGRISHVTTQRTLPADLIHWTATAGEKEVYLSWATAAEDNTASFRLDRSTDGISFGPLATKSAAGTSNERSEYAHTDTDPALGTLYYRLTQVDNDGTEEVYPIRRVYFADGKTNGPTLSPNPVIQDLTVQVPELQETGPISVRLFSTDGREVFVRHTLRDGGPQRLDLVLPNLPAGIYRAVISYDDRVFTRNLTVR